MPQMSRVAPRWSGWALWGWIAASALLAGPLTPIRAEDAPRRPVTGLDIQVNLVRSAAEAKDAEWMDRLAAADDPDPWLIADRLCELGAYNDALAFARAGVRPDTATLAAYVEELRDASDTQKKRIAILREKVALGAVPWRLSRGNANVPALILFQIKANDLLEQGRDEPAEKLLMSGAAAAVELGWLAQATGAYRQAADIAVRREDFTEARAALNGLYSSSKKRNRADGIFRALLQLGELSLRTEENGNAFKFFEQARTLAERAELQSLVAESWRATSRVLASEEKYDEARAALDHALEVSADLDDAGAIALASEELAALQAAAGDLEGALETYKRVRQMRDDMDDVTGVVSAHRSLAKLNERLDRREAAISNWEAVLAGLATTNAEEALADATVELGELYRTRGNFNLALQTLEAARDRYSKLGLESQKARVVARIARVHIARRDLESAKEAYGLSMDLLDALGEEGLIGETHDEMSELCRLKGDGSGAVECSKRAVEGAQRNGDPISEAEALLNGGLAEHQLGHMEAAEENAKRALEIFETENHLDGQARAMVQLGNFHLSSEDLPQALKFFDAGIKLAEDLELAGTAIDGRWAQAEALLRSGNPKAAVETIRVAVLLLPEVLRGASDLRGSVARTSYAPLISMGLGAAVQLDDAEAASFFLESGRAGAMLEMLGNSAELQGALISADTRRRLDKAKKKVARARNVLQAAIPTQSRKIIRFVRDHLKEAEREEEDAIDEVQREEKSIAQIMYPQADPLPVIQERLGPSDALVLYGRSMDIDPESRGQTESYVALVVGSHATRLVELGAVSELDDILADVRPVGPDQDMEAPKMAAQDAFVKPLGLGINVVRVLVSPEGPIAFTPLALLFEGRDVCLVPSGTTLGRLQRDSEKRGDRVLALADPNYAKLAQTLPLLPYSRVEAEELGDKLLLGNDATEARLLAALAENADGRWRGVHLACHGTVDEEYPLRSKLVVTPPDESEDEQEDGYLQAIEIYRMQIPADVVTLSACETGRGKMQRGEGVLGLVRGFMIAGAPRVVSSLWQVDDKATRALMVKFYELWNPDDGTGSLGAAAALRAAQDEVKQQEKWSHPWYWAGWVLWGLAE